MVSLPRCSSRRLPGRLLAAAAAAVAAPELGTGDRADDLLLRRLRHLVHARLAAESQHEDAIDDVEDVREVVRDDDHAETLLAQPSDEREHLLGLCDAE